MSKILNTTNIALSYSPGNSAYGQKGCNGNSGKNGSSIYYASYSIKDNEEYCLEQIRSNKELSNLRDVSNNLTYIENDIIIDSNGSIYKLYLNAYDLLSFKEVGLFNEKNNNVDAYINTENSRVYIDSIKYEEYSKDSLGKSPIVSQRFYIKYILPGVFVKFKLDLSENIKNTFAVTYNIHFPNGEVMSVQNDFDTNSDHGVFVSLGALYGIYDFKDEIVPEEEITLKEYIGHDTEWFNKEFSDEKILKTAANYISSKCFATFEILNVLTGDIFTSNIFNINNLNE